MSWISAGKFFCSTVFSCGILPNWKRVLEGVHEKHPSSPTCLIRHFHSFSHRTARKTYGQMSTALLEVLLTVIALFKLKFLHIVYDEMGRCDWNIKTCYGADFVTMWSCFMSGEPPYCWQCKRLCHLFWCDVFVKQKLSPNSPNISLQAWRRLLPAQQRMQMVASRKCRRKRPAEKVPAQSLLIKISRQTSPRNTDGYLRKSIRHNVGCRKKAPGLVAYLNVTIPEKRC